MNYSDYMAANYDVINGLRRLGLNQYQARAYLALHAFGEHTAGELSEHAKLPRPRIYDVVKSLQNIGFVAIRQGRPVKYVALPLAEALKTLKKQKEGRLAEELTKVDDIGRELAARMKTKTPVAPPTEENIWTLKGREAIYSKIASMISGAKKDVYIASVPEQLMHKIRTHSKELRRARSRGVRISVIAPVEGSGEVTKVAHSIYNKLLPTRMLVADNQALIFLTDHKTKPEEEIGVWMQSPHFVHTMKHAMGVK